MGFFTDIIRESKRPVGLSAPEDTERVSSVTSAGQQQGRNALQVSDVSFNDSLNPAENPLKNFWEEEIGQSRAARTGVPPLELEHRQVVGPSLSENTEDSDLAKAQEHDSNFPDHEKQKQTGPKNRHDVTVRSKRNRDLTLHDAVSFGKESYSSKDPSVVKPISKRQEQSAHGKSVDVTLRRRQAGRMTRAGATTPPKPTTPDRTASTPVRSLPRSVEKSPAPKDGLASHPTMATHSDTVVEKTNESRTERLEYRGETGGLASPNGIKVGGKSVQPALPAIEKAKDSGRRIVEPSVPAKKNMATDDEDIPVENPNPVKPITSDRTTSTQARPLPMSVEKSPAPEDGRGSPSIQATHSDTVVGKTDEPRTERLESRKKRGETGALVFPAGIEDCKNPVPPALPTVEEAKDSGRRTGELSVPAEETMAVHSETVVPKTEESRMGRLESREERGETQALAFPNGIKEGGTPVPPDLPAVEEADDSGRRTVEPSVPAKKTMVAGDEDIPMQIPIKVSFPDEQAPEPLQADPREESTSQTAAEPPVSAPGYPKVHIGLLEVVVSAPENASVRKISNLPAGHNFASRHYLRNL